MYCLCAPRNHGAAAVRTTAWLFIVNMVYVVMAIEARYNHAGKVCSGDYTYYELTTEQQTGYLISEGMWIQAYLVGMGV